MNIGNSFAAAGFSRLAALAFALALPSLVSATTNSREESPQATSSSVYADVIGSARFERSAIKVEQGYTVESGNLYTRDGDTGSLVVVRSPSGSVTVIVNSPDKRGLLTVNAQGKSTFTEEPITDADARGNDVIESGEPMGLDSKKAGEHRYVDILFAYIPYVLGKLDADAIAYALAQTETVNLSLRNSRITDVSLRLAAVTVFDNSNRVLDTSSEGLSNWQSLLSPYRALYKTDVSAAITGSDAEAGRAYRPGYTSVNAWWAPTTFAHEIGHNAGGHHCFLQDGVNYNFGHDNGKTKTNLCYGDRAFYYSTPDVLDAHGLPLGNAKTADMARVWRENTTRLTGYNAELPGLRMMLVSPSGAPTEAISELDIPLPDISLFPAGVVALNSSVGPVELIPIPNSTWTRLNVPLRSAGGSDVAVVLQGQRVRGVCETNMNVTNCKSKRAMSLRIRYNPADNPGLAGYYNGLLKLEARSPDLTSWKVPINIAISVKR